MKSKLSLPLVIAILVASAISFGQDKLPTDEPPGYGVYYKTKDGWQKLDYARPLGSSVGAFSGATLNYHGAEAALQITDRRPVFFFDRNAAPKKSLLPLFFQSTPT